MDVRDRLTRFVGGLPVAHRVGIVTAVVVLGVVGVVFSSWLTTPSYTVLFSGLDDTAVAETVAELETLGVPYELEGGGSTVLVPRDRLYQTRASLAASGVAGTSTPQGYELLDDQGLSVSDFRQRVDYRRALEGELARTLVAMSGIDAAQVHLVIPEQRVFSDQQEETTASVLLTTSRDLGVTEVEAVTFLVASSVEGLGPEEIAVADADGTVLHAPGDAAGATQLASRHLRQTREFEQAMASDITALLGEATGSPASVVVRATLDFDESETSTESWDADSQVTLKEHTSTEQYEGTGATPGGTVGVDGQDLPAGEAESGTYARDDTTREYGVDRTTTRTVTAPGEVQRLSVAIVMDDGSLSGNAIPGDEEVTALVTAAVGLEEARGDAVAVTRVPMAAPEEAVVEEPTSSMLADLAQYVGIAVLLLVAIALFLMTRQRVTVQSVVRDERDDLAVQQLPGGTARALDREPVPAMSASVRDDVVDLVQGQPEEIANLLRGWLADRRTTP